MLLPHDSAPDKRSNVLFFYGVFDGRNVFHDSGSKIELRTKLTNFNYK
jgi:hypothetical protein